MVRSAKRMFEVNHLFALAAPFHQCLEHLASSQLLECPAKLQPAGSEDPLKVVQKKAMEEAVENPDRYEESLATENPAGRFARCSPMISYEDRCSAEVSSARKSWMMRAVRPQIW